MELLYILPAQRTNFGTSEVIRASALEPRVRFQHIRDHLPRSDGPLPRAFSLEMTKDNYKV